MKLNWQHPWQLSIAIHGAALGFLLLLSSTPPLPLQKILVEVPVVEVPIPAAPLQIPEEKLVVIKSINAAPQPAESAPPPQAKYGISRDAYTDEGASATGISAKIGNTLAKEADSEVLTADEAGQLPSPTEEYLVTQMPTVKKEVRPLYPESAKAERLEGSVAMEILIDETGKVRQAQVVSGPAPLQAAALAAIYQFIFAPAQVDSVNVAVKIRYTIRFQLEY